MSWRSDRRKLRQTIGMIKVLVPAFIAIWLWKRATTESLSHVWMVIAPSKTQVFVNESITVPIYVTGALQQLQLSVSSGDRHFEIMPEDTSQTKRKYSVKLKWGKVGEYLLIAQALINRGTSSEDVKYDTVAFKVTENPRPRLETLPYQVRQCTKNMLDIETESYTAWVVEDTLYRKSTGHDFDPRTRTLRVSGNMGVFQLHGTSKNDPLGVIYRFEVIRNNPPVRISDDEIVIGGRSPAKPGVFISYSFLIEDPDGEPLDPNPQLIETSDPRWNNAIKSAVFEIPEGLPRGPHFIKLKFRYCGEGSTTITIRFNQR